MSADFELFERFIIIEGYQTNSRYFVKVSLLASVYLLFCCTALIGRIYAFNNSARVATQQEWSYGTS